MAYSSYQNSDNIVPYFVALVADELADIAEIPTHFAVGIAASFYAPKLWAIAKAWIVAKLS